MAGLKPIIDKQSRILILGSFPGRQSLIKKQYYANSQNHFWRIIASVLGIGDVPVSYLEKTKMLLTHRIALWDVVQSCCRQGSRDDTIRAVEINDFNSFLKKYPNINAIFCNGKKSYQLFKQYYDSSNIPCEYLPSSSPLNTQTFDFKKKRWMKIV